jgi:L-ribulose-5-phosphate 3-epimerase
MILNRRRFLTALPAAALPIVSSGVHGETGTVGEYLDSLTPDGGKAGGPAAQTDRLPDAVLPPHPEQGLLFSCKSSMLQGDTPADKLRLAKEAGYDGVDYDQAGSVAPAQLRDAVRETGVFVHNAINHAHWKATLTSDDAAKRAQGLENLKHCIRVSHAGGGNAVLLVVGSGDDGPADVIAERARAEIRKAIPLAAALGQRILFENVWNRMFYKQDGPRDQTAQEFNDFVDSFNSPWVGMFFDLGNHARYGDVAQWTRQMGSRIVKLDIKGYDNARADRDGPWKGFVDITAGDIDWASVRGALKDIGFTGWVSAEVGGGDLDRHRAVLTQMKEALLGSA